MRLRARRYLPSPEEELRTRRSQAECGMSLGMNLRPNSGWRGADGHVTMNSIGIAAGILETATGRLDISLFGSRWNNEHRTRRRHRPGNHVFVHRVPQRTRGADIDPQPGGGNLDSFRRDA